MSTLAELRAVVQRAVGRSDATAQAIIANGLNMAQVVVALMFEPPELTTEGSLVATTAQPYVSSTTLTRLLTINNVYNTTAGSSCWEIPFDKREAYPLPTSGNVKYWSVYGQRLYYFPTPSGNETLAVWHLQYPVDMTADGDSPSCDNYDDDLIALATQYYWASQEEVENVDMIAKAISLLGYPQTIITQIRKAQRHGYNIPGTQAAGVTQPPTR